MKRSILSLVLIPVAAAACADQQSQPLPFDSEPLAVTRTVPASGGTVSTPAGASVVFPAGAFAGSQSVTLTPRDVPAALAASGRAISAYAFSVEPAGVPLGAPARVEVRFGGQGEGSAWLASLAAVSPAGVVELADTRVDVAAGIASASLPTLGTLAVVVPGPDAYVARDGGPARSASRALSAAALQALLESDSLRVRCGGPANRCAGLSFEVSENLLSRVERAAVVYPRLQGGLRVENGELVGRVTVDASFRAVLADGQVAENVRLYEAFDFHVGVGPAVEGSDLSRSVSGTQAATLHVPEDGGDPHATVRHALQIPSPSGGMEPASISITFPFEVYR